MAEIMNKMEENVNIDGESTNDDVWRSKHFDYMIKNKISSMFIPMHDMVYAECGMRNVMTITHICPCILHSYTQTHTINKQAAAAISFSSEWISLSALVLSHHFI